MTKEFKLIKALDYRYAINENGDLYSLFGPHGLRYKPLKLLFELSKDGYLKRNFTLDNNKKLKTSLHRILASVFLGLDFDDKLKQTNHKDGNKLNNMLNNLEIVSNKENARHAAKLNLHNKNCKMKFSDAEKQKFNNNNKVTIN